MSWQSVLEEVSGTEKGYECMETHLSASTPIYVGTQIAESLLKDELIKLKADQIFIISDAPVLRLYGKSFITQLKDIFGVHLITFPGGEAHKTMTSIIALADKLFAKNVSKDSVIVALGGGIVGNVAGLIAAQIFRGIPFIQVPTTFLAQTDSIMSRKQAVNTRYGKNMLGVYYTPVSNIVDVRFLLSEDERSIRSGLVETVKNGLINDPTLFAYMKNKIPHLKLNKLEELEMLVKLSIKSKIDIIKTDPTEKKRGMILEYGHTAGHAIEKIMKGKMTHGECVAIGMVAAAKISNQLGMLTKDQVKLHEEVLTALGMPITLPTGLKAYEVMDIIEHDNKRESDGIKYVLLEDIGRTKVVEDKYMLPVPNVIVESVLISMMS